MKITNNLKTYININLFFSSVLEQNVNPIQNQLKRLFCKFQQHSTIAMKIEFTKMPCLFVRTHTNTPKNQSDSTSKHVHQVTVHYQHQILMLNHKGRSIEL